MVNNTQAQLNDVFIALSDPTRRQMLERLASGVMSVKDLSDPFKMSKPAITKHLKILERAGLLKRQKQGRVHHCFLQADPLSQVADWVSYYKQFWESQFDALENYLNSTTDSNSSD